MTGSRAARTLVSRLAAPAAGRHGLKRLNGRAVSNDGQLCCSVIRGGSLGSIRCVLFWWALSPHWTGPGPGPLKSDARLGAGRRTSRRRPDHLGGPAMRARPPPARRRRCRARPPHGGSGSDSLSRAAPTCHPGRPTHRGLSRVGPGTGAPASRAAGPTALASRISLNLKFRD